MLHSGCSSSYPAAVDSAVEVHGHTASPKRTHVVRRGTKRLTTSRWHSKHNMRHLMLLAALAALIISSCTAHRGLQQLADPAEPAAVSATATQPQYFKLFAPDAFAPTNPVAAAAHPGVEVTLAGAPVSERAAAAAASAAALVPASIPLRPAGSFERSVQHHAELCWTTCFPNCTSSGCSCLQVCSSNHQPARA